ncbi:hypothetical protein Syun_021459 [Stephania yunnanensis]|uniref:Rieske domain-containing protein n=1 Tax=Stephania yunnanensis TaxID=152371 RepID=A0AAP0IHM2_9MAGN
MQSLTTSSFNLSKIPKSLPPPNGFTLLPIFPQLPTSSLPHLTHKTTSKSKRFSIALPRDPSPELEDSEIGEESETFDWYSQWYPVAPICDLDKRVPHAKRVMGIDIVVWWDRKEEKWQVFDDSCPHRLAPLSEGRIDQWGRLQCVYHGWCFDGAGDCNFIPQAPPDGPPVGNNGSVSLVTPKEEPPRDARRRKLLVCICIPVSPGKSRLIWYFPTNFGVWIERLIPRWIFHIGQNLILDSDLYLLHLEEHKILDVGSENWQKACFIPTNADALVVGFRKWLRKYSNNQIDWRSKFSTMLPPSLPKEQLMDRYWSHVVHCSSCRTAMKGLRALEVALQVISLASIGVVAAVKQNVISAAARTAVVSMAVLCFAASRWLSHFIYKNFYFHDYNHALR